MAFRFVLAAYSFADYAIALWVFVPFVIWLTVEFFGLLTAWIRLKGRIMGTTPASAQEAAQRVTEAQYAATRNARQALNGGRNGKGH